VVRLAHPFPSLLNAAATLTIATLAGAPMLVAGRLALSMLAIQASIGALNDLADAERDAVAKPGKPLPAGLASRRDAMVLAGLGGASGLLLTLPSGAAATGVLAFGLAMGYLYDLRLSRTRWSWLPLALALPVVPIHAWLGAAGSVPAGLAGLVPVAVVAGAALSLANGLVDLERDAASDRPTLGVALGAARAWRLHALLVGVLVALALLLLPRIGAVAADVSPVLPGALLQAVQLWGVGLGVGALAIGAMALRAGRPAIRERGWELEAVGVAAIGVGWLAGLAAASGR
jgi:4-hydroxybenzoate polyprenyltransferase